MSHTVVFFFESDVPLQGRRLVLSLTDCSLNLHSVSRMNGALSVVVACVSESSGYGLKVQLNYNFRFMLCWQTSFNLAYVISNCSRTNIGSAEDRSFHLKRLVKLRCGLSLNPRSHLSIDDEVRRLRFHFNWKRFGYAGNAVVIHTIT